MEKEYPTSSPRPLECVQSAGDLLFVPNDHSHAVVALEETVAMSALLIYEPEPQSCSSRGHPSDSTSYAR